MRTALCAVLLAGLALAESVAALSPPDSPKQESASVIHGASVADPWRWLEATDAPRVQDWIGTQNAYAEAHLADTVLGDALTARIGELSHTGTLRYAPQLAGGTLFYFQFTPPQAQPVLMAQTWLQGEARALVDPNALDGDIAITEVWPSPTGRYLAYGVAEGGAELIEHADALGAFRRAQRRGGNPVRDDAGGRAGE